MNFQICTGIQEQAGVTKQGNVILFSIQAPQDAKCKLLLYPRDNGTENSVYCGGTGAGLGELRL